MTLSIQLQNVADYIRKKIAETDPAIDTRPSSGVGDILIKALSEILQPVADELIRIDKNQSLQNGPSMTEQDLDDLIANIFLTRSPGAKARGNVRVFFTDPTNITIPQGSEFTSADGIRFFSLLEVTITANQMSVNKDGDFYYVDALVEAEDTGSAGNVAAGTIVDFVGGPSTLLKVDNVDGFQGGIDREGNAALIARAKEAITVRDLVSKPAIKTVLREAFATIQDLRVVGFGDPEMERDFLIGQNLQLGLFVPVDQIDGTAGVHIGGKVDVYIRVVTLSQEAIRIDDIKQLVYLRPKDVFDPTIDPANVQFMTLIKRPFVDVSSLQEIDPVTGDPVGSPLVRGVDFAVVVDNRTLRFSTRDRVHLNMLNGGVLGGSFMLTYSHSPETVAVQNFMDDEDHRVVTADILAKFTNPAFVDFSAVFSLADDATITAAGMLSKIEQFINSLAPGARLEVSDLVKLMYDNGADFVQLPITVTVTVLQNDGTELVATSNNFVEAPSTAAYLPRTITLTEV